MPVHHNYGIWLEGIFLVIHSCDPGYGPFLSIPRNSKPNAKVNNPQMPVT
jgi:hypothetical protein